MQIVVNILSACQHIKRVSVFLKNFEYDEEEGRGLSKRGNFSGISEML